jgi:hypothetical protein
MVLDDEDSNFGHRPPVRLSVDDTDARKRLHGHLRHSPH